MKKIGLKIENQIIEITLNDSKLAKEIYNHLPMQVDFERYDDREYFTILDFTPIESSITIDDFFNGAFTYFPELNTLAVFFDREKESSCPGLKLLGTVTSNLDVLARFDKKISVQLEPLS